MSNTSFNLNSSLSSNDNAACAFRDSPSDSSEKLSTFLNTRSPNEVARFLFLIFVHMSFRFLYLLIFSTLNLSDMGGLPLRSIQIFNSPSRKAFFHLAI